MSKRGAGMRADVIRILTESTVPLRSYMIAEQLGTPSRTVCAVLNALRRNEVKGFEHFEQRKIDGIMWYVIGSEKFGGPHAVKASKIEIILPQDIVRGWFNPKTGIAGSKLGV